MTTTTEGPAVRLFLAPINEPVRGKWIPVDDVDPTREIRYRMEEVRQETGSEELRISTAEGIPRSLIPQYGGVPVEKIAAFVRIATEHSLGAAQAFVRLLNLVGIDVPGEEWPAAFDWTHGGVQDSLKDWAEEDIREGVYPGLSEAIDSCGWSYINLDRVVRDLKMHHGREFVETDDGVHCFWSHELDAFG